MVRAFWALAGPVLLLGCGSVIVAKRLHFPGVFDVIYVVIAGAIIAARLVDSHRPDRSDSKMAGTPYDDTTSAAGYCIFWGIISLAFLVLIHLVLKHR